jgi:hypothetical protein
MFDSKKWFKEQYKISAHYRKQLHDAQQKWREKIKNTILDHYGRKCSCCGESNIKFLTIDHTNGGGSKHRKRINSNGSYGVWKEIIRLNFPPEYQTLCMNCNWGRRLTGICPHKTI